MKKVIFSIDQDGQLAEYEHYTMVLGFLVNMGIKVTEGTGCYKGVTERCFICTLNHKYHYNMIKSAARRFNQESILVISELGMSTLVYMDGTKREFIGQWRVVDRGEAIKSDSFTYDIDRNEFYKAG